MALPPALRTCPRCPSALPTHHKGQPPAPTAVTRRRRQMCRQRRPPVGRGRAARPVDWSTLRTATARVAVTSSFPGARVVAGRRRTRCSARSSRYECAPAHVASPPPRARSYRTAGAAPTQAPDPCCRREGRSPTCSPRRTREVTAAQTDGASSMHRVSRCRPCGAPSTLAPTPGRCGAPPHAVVCAPTHLWHPSLLLTTKRCPAAAPRGLAP